MEGLGTAAQRSAWVGSSTAAEYLGLKYYKCILASIRIMDNRHASHSRRVT